MCTSASAAPPVVKTSALQRLYGIAKARLDGKAEPDGQAVQQIAEALCELFSLYKHAKGRQTLSQHHAESPQHR